MNSEYRTKTRNNEKFSQQHCGSLSNVNLYFWLIVDMKPIEYCFHVFGKCIKETIK